MAHVSYKPSLVAVQYAVTVFRLELEILSLRLCAHAMAIRH